MFSTPCRLPGSPISAVAHGTGVLVEHKTSRGFAVVRVAANGAIDRTFAASQPDGVLLAGDAALPVVEFHNSLLNHYFMTADPGEIANIEAGGAGAGWSRTGESFAAYPGILNAPGDALAICRFYGSSWAAPASPNGRAGLWTKNDSNHRYTTSRAIIAEMVGKGWTDEGKRFCAP